MSKLEVSDADLCTLIEFGALKDTIAGIISLRLHPPLGVVRHNEEKAFRNFLYSNLRSSYRYYRQTLKPVLDRLSPEYPKIKRIQKDFEEECSDYL